MTEHFTGSLMYGDEYGEDVGQEVLFELELERSNSEFSGVSRDISGFGVNESPALVKGSLVNDRISLSNNISLSITLKSRLHQIDF
ncbi:hypothetical protein [Owenweeksia hongkongensis]|uniref:hypothetical protein n=1 Tax=Owenweeksia hongkongensis TaxID=253245 RepID=UPI003A8DAB4B